MLSIVKTIPKSKTIFDDTMETVEDKAIVTIMNRKELRLAKDTKTTAQKLQDLNLAGVWKNRKIKNGSSFSDKLRKKMGFRSAA